MLTTAVAESSTEPPRGVTLIAAVFFLSSAYLLVLGTIRLLVPGAVSLSLGAPLLHGFELAGPYAFLLGAAAAAIVGAGLLRLNKFARRAAIAICIAGMVLLIPKVSAAAMDISPRFFWAGSMVVARMMIVWYLWQQAVAEKFR